MLHVVSDNVHGTWEIAFVKIVKFVGQTGSINNGDNIVTIIVEVILVGISTRGIQFDGIVCGTSCGAIQHGILQCMQGGSCGSYVGPFHKGHRAYA